MEVLEKVRYSSIDELLGPKDKRYCSSGFKNVNFSFSNVVIARSSLEAKVHVDFSKKWSSKNNESLKPHLGTTEYFNIAVILSELLLISHFELDDLAISKSRVTCLKIKAKPAGELHLIQDAKVDYKGTIEAGSGAGASSFDICIGHMAIRFTIVHEMRNPRTEAPYADFSVYLNHLQRHFYKTGYKECTTEIEDVEVDMEERLAQCAVSFKSPSDRFGIGSYYPTMNIANFILIAGQLMQVLLYELEGIRRDQSKNLWLRGLEINFDKPVSKMNANATVYCQTFKEVILRGEKWRIADFAVSMESLSAKFYMTHQIV